MTGKTLIDKLKRWHAPTHNPILRREVEGDRPILSNLGLIIIVIDVVNAVKERVNLVLAE
jgi:hypothetical protein